MGITSRLFFLTLCLILFASTANAVVGYKKKFNPETGRGDWVIDETTLPSSSGGSCWELDGNSDLQPIAASCTDTLWEEDGNGDLQPQT